jgi:uncharacterized protein
LNTTLQIKKSKFGIGLFTDNIISEGKSLLKIKGNIIKSTEVELLGDDECYPFQISPTEYIAPLTDTNWQYINHSCEPNCGVNENLELIALRDILPEEEIFYDYSTTMLERRWTMKCECGSNLCRSIILDFDSLPKETISLYKGKKIVQPYILNAL